MAGDFRRPGLAAIDRDVGKPNMSPIDFVGALPCFDGANFHSGHGTPHALQTNFGSEKWFPLPVGSPGVIARQQRPQRAAEEPSRRS